MRVQNFLSVCPCRLRPNPHGTRAFKFAGNSFDVVCIQSEHCHLQQQVPFACVCASRAVWIGPLLTASQPQGTMNCQGLYPLLGIIQPVSSEISTRGRKHNKTHNALLIFCPQLLELKSDFPPDGDLHSQPVDIQATTGTQLTLKSNSEL